MTNSRKVCQDCGGSVRYDEATDAYYHIMGVPQLETIARNVRDADGKVTL